MRRSGTSGVTAWRELRKSAVHCPAIRRRLFPLLHPVVAHHVRHAQAVVTKHAVTAGRLRRLVRFQRAPALHSVFIAPERQRQQAAGLRERFEPFHRHEAIDRLERRAQRLRRGEVLTLARERRFIVRETRTFTEAVEGTLGSRA